ncbi:glycosyltransferase family 1 protein [Tabrizicola sp. TH137]|uniref:glycosyltransferase family 4 protein n=1 Tax=Tabrizicola sp. TH137 TaxID=2067452 RepID=UPI000C7D3998|nr:glycosyltransferase family 4 protein [Tabrizicola sp. TH137]PLL13609.1 glycosyltransferase family 1 protein [Tabrizicola sp. TH137]
MRIAYLCPDGGIPVFGDKGGSVHVRAMIRAFRAEGHEVEVFCAETGDGPADFAVTALGPDFPPAEGREAKERRLLALADALQARLEQQHRHRPFDLIYERYGLWSAAGVRAGRRLGIPAVIEVNAPLVEEQAAFRKFVLQDAARAIEAEVFSTADALAVVSRELAVYVASRGAGPEAIHVIGNAVDCAAFHPAIPAAEVPGLPDTAFTIGFTGSLKAWHGTDLLVEALARLRPAIDARLLIVGDGPERGALLDHAARHGLSHAVTITGWVPHHRLPGLIARMDAAVAPYPAMANHYFSPLKLFEYLAMGRAIVASRIGQTADLLGPDGSGLLVPPGDAVALADALHRIATDAPLAARLRQRAAMQARHHDWRANARRIVDLIPRAKAA